MSLDTDEYRAWGLNARPLHERHGGPQGPCVNKSEELIARNGKRQQQEQGSGSRTRELTDRFQSLAKLLEKVEDKNDLILFMKAFRSWPE